MCLFVRRTRTLIDRDTSSEGDRVIQATYGQTDESNQIDRNWRNNCVYVCMYMCMYICIYACMHVGLCVSECSGLQLTYVCLSVFLHIMRVHVCMHVCFMVCVHVRMHVCTYVYVCMQVLTIVCILCIAVGLL